MLTLKVGIRSEEKIVRFGAHDEATALAERALQRDPNDSASLHVRGNFHQFQGEFDQAEAMHEASLRSDPTLFQNIMAEIRATVSQPWVIMEICGGQTHAILKHGLDQLLPAEIELGQTPGPDDGRRERGAL
jgi:tetratricopeptide (TPR) repeat protein